jgi:hypothetical protein
MDSKYQLPMGGSRANAIVKRVVLVACSAQAMVAEPLKFSDVIGCCLERCWWNYWSALVMEQTEQGTAKLDDCVSANAVHPAVPQLYGILGWEGPASSSSVYCCPSGHS